MMWFIKYIGVGVAIPMKTTQTVYLSVELILQGDLGNFEQFCADPRPWVHTILIKTQISAGTKIFGSLMIHAFSVGISLSSIRKPHLSFFSFFFHYSGVYHVVQFHIRRRNLPKSVVWIRQVKTWSHVLETIVTSLALLRLNMAEKKIEYSVIIKFVQLWTGVIKRKRSGQLGSFFLKRFKAYVFFLGFSG